MTCWRPASSLSQSVQYAECTQVQLLMQACNAKLQHVKAAINRHLPLATSAGLHLWVMSAQGAWTQHSGQHDTFPLTTWLETTLYLLQRPPGLKLQGQLIMLLPKGAQLLIHFLILTHQSGLYHHFTLSERCRQLHTDVEILASTSCLDICFEYLL